MEYNKRVTGITLAIVMLMMVIYIISRAIILLAFENLEREQASESVDRTRNLLMSELASLQGIAQDWAARDETYDFLQSHSANRLTSTLAPEALAGIQVNVLALVDAKGRIVLAKGFDYRRKIFLPVPDGLTANLTPTAPILREATRENAYSGVLTLPKESAPLLIVADPVTTSKRQGPSRGTLVLGRFLDASAVQQLINLSTVHLTLMPYDDAHLPKNFKVGRGETSYATPYIYFASHDTMEGYVVIRDVVKRPVMLLQVDLPRKVYRQAENTLRYFLIGLLVIGVVFGLTANRLLKIIEESELELQKREMRLVSEERYRQLVEFSPDGVFIYAQDQCVFANAAGALLLGYMDAPEVIGHDFLSVIPDDQQGLIRNLLRQLETRRTSARVETQLRRYEGGFVDVELALNRFSHENSRAIQIIAHDISSRKIGDTTMLPGQESVRHPAYHDLITGLPTQQLFTDRLIVAMARARRLHTRVALVSLDLVEFAKINQSWGHEVGDDLLKAVAERMVRQMRETDTVARLGGDDFGLILPDIVDDSCIHSAAARLLNVFATPFEVNSQHIALKASIGICVSGEEQQSVQALLQSAATARKTARARGPITAYEVVDVPTESVTT